MKYENKPFRKPHFSFPFSAFRFVPHAFQQPARS
jgi:hypothetical protein